MKSKTSLRNRPQTSRQPNQLIEKKDFNQLCCSRCNFNFKNEEELKSHLKPHCKRKLVFDHCNFETNFYSSLKRLIIIHSNTKLFKCSHCPYECITKGNLKRHTLSHTNDCGHECNEKGNLKQHMLRHPNFRLFKNHSVDTNASKRDT